MRRVCVLACALASFFVWAGCNQQTGSSDGRPAGDAAVGDASDATAGDDANPNDGSGDMGVPMCNSATPDCPSGRWCNTSNGECASCPTDPMVCSDFDSTESSIDTETSRVTLKFAWGSVHVESFSVDAEQNRSGVGSGWGDAQIENKGVDGPTSVSINFGAPGSGDLRINSVTVTDICGDSHTLPVNARWTPSGDITEGFSCSPMTGGGG